MFLEFKWNEHIDEYASQYNTGAHQSLGRLSPFEVFFGRAPNVRTTILESIENTNVNVPDGQASCIEKAELLRKKADESSTKSADKMAFRNKRKFPPADYSVNEEVIIKYVYMGKKIKSKAEKTFPGVVKNVGNDKYQIQYTKKGKSKLERFPVSLVTSKTRFIENEKHSSKRAKTLKKLKHDYHLQNKKHDQQVNDELKNDLVGVLEKADILQKEGEMNVIAKSM